MTVSENRPHDRQEAALHKKGHKFIAGVDEAGRGAWAGPLVAGAVILPVDFPIKHVRDSKTLTARQREKRFVHIARGCLAWAVGVVEAETVDRVGLTAANRAAMLLALRRLHQQPTAILLDAVRLRYDGKPTKAIIDGDAKVLSIAAASIVAKVVRDALMDDLDRQYPNFGFRRHRGYGTLKHRRALRTHGPSPVHRRSFRPVGQLPGKR